MSYSLQDYEDQSKNAKITLQRVPKCDQRRLQEGVSLLFWMT